MKKFLAIATVLVATFNAAHAQVSTQDLVKSATIVVMYSQACGEVKPELLRAAIGMVRSDLDTYHNLIEQTNLLTQKYLSRMSPAEAQKVICDMLEPRVAAMSK